MVELSALMQGFGVILTPMNFGLMLVGIILGVVVSAAFFAMFEVWFKVPLYKGTLDPLAFLGY